MLRCCREAVKYGFYAVCVNSCYVPIAAKALRGTGVKVCSTVGFPLGSQPTEVKVCEAEWALRHGADELDMVMNIGLFRSGRYEEVKRDIEAIVSKAREYEHVIGKDVVVKVIIETGLLSVEEIVKAALIVRDSGADFVKTCTGFGPRGVTVDDVRIIRQAVGPSVGVKAAGGVRTAEQALMLLEAGADRIGTSRGVDVVLSLRE